MKQRNKKRNKRKSPQAQNEVLVLQNGERALVSEQFSEAISYFASISKDSPNYARACKGHGAALLRMQRWSEAFPFLQIAYKAFPNNPEILVDGGDIARLMGNLSAAEDTYQEARKLGADGFQIRFGEALICQERKLWIEAVRLWTELNKSYPNNPLVLHNLGKVWHELGETDQAVSLMLEALELGGETITLSMLGMLAPHAGSFDHEKVRKFRVKLGERLKLEEGNPSDCKNHGRKKGRINIGYVSAFFHRRNWMKPVWALLNHHDRDQFNLHLFADSPPDEINNEGGYVAHRQDKIYDVRKLGNRELAKLISDCEIDVLVDLNSYSAMNRLGLWESWVMTTDSLV